MAVFDGVDGSELLARCGGNGFCAAAGVAHGGFQYAALHLLGVGDCETQREAGFGVGGRHSGEHPAQMSRVKGQAQAQECVENAHDYQWARIVGNQGTVWHRLGDMENARMAFEACLSVFHDLGYRSEEGLALINLGVCMMRLGEPHQECAEVFYRSLRCGEELGSASMQANAYSSLAEVHSLMGQDIEAIEFCKKSITLYQKGVWLVQTAWTFVNLANLLNKVGAFEESALIWQAACRLESLANTKFTPRQKDILSNLHHSYRQNLLPELLKQKELRCGDASSDELINLALQSIDTVLKSVMPR